MLAFAIVPLALAALASAQDATAIAAIDAHLTQAGIEPGCLPEFSPQAFLQVNFDGTVGAIQPGQKISVEESQPTPGLTLAGANSSVAFAGDYTVAMVDCDIVGADTAQVTRHWLINGAKVENNALTVGGVNVITPYGAPLPAEGSGSHRYVLVVYAQPEGFTPPANPPSNAPIEKFSLSEYVTSANLGAPIAANYYQVEVGTASASVSATQAVESGTLASAAASGSPSGSASGSKSAASPSSTAAAPNGASILAAGTASAVMASVFGLFMTFF